MPFNRPTQYFLVFIKLQSNKLILILKILKLLMEFTEPNLSEEYVIMICSMFKVMGLKGNPLGSDIMSIFTEENILLEIIQII